MVGIMPLLLYVETHFCGETKCTIYSLLSNVKPWFFIIRFTDPLTIYVGVFKKNKIVFTCFYFHQLLLQNLFCSEENYLFMNK